MAFSQYSSDLALKFLLQADDTNPVQSEQFCSDTAEGGEYGAIHYRQARPRTLWITLSSV
jgi:hypothetical protein